MKPLFADKQGGAFLFVASQEDAMLTMSRPYRNKEGATARGRTQLPIEELAERQLRGNSYLALKNLSCEYRDGALVLRGLLPTYYLKQLAQEAVAHVEGVARIENQIQVLAPDLRAR
jgi:osmotically-inducible protein OsmY